MAETVITAVFPAPTQWGEEGIVVLKHPPDGVFLMLV
jgi:hypothetical protein